MMKLIALMGIPGSGKSRYAHHFKDYVRISADDFFKRDASASYFWYDVDNKKKIFGIDSVDCLTHVQCIAAFWDVLLARLKNGENILCDNPFVTALERISVVRVAAAFGYDTTLIWVQVPTDVAIERNRNRQKRLPDSCVLDHARRLDIPIPDEGWNRIRVVDNY